MKLPRLYLSLLAGIALLASGPLRAADDRDLTSENAELPTEPDSPAGGVSTIKFSDPSKPGTLRLNVMQGDLRITGSPGSEVVVRSELQPESTAPRPDGLRVLSSSSSYSLTEKDNVVTLRYGTDGWPTSSSDFSVTVPHNTNVVISNSLGGDTEVSGISGNLEIKSLNGEVRLRDVAGGVLVETMNGEIAVDVRQLVDGKPLSFSSMNGEVELHLPVDSKANLRLRTHNGSILTDFDEKQLVTKTASVGGPGPWVHGEVAQSVREVMQMSAQAAREAAQAARDAMRVQTHVSDDGVDVEVHSPIPPTPPLPPMTGGKIVTGTLNGGGPEIRVTTMNGSVTLRKSTAPKP